MLRAGPVNRKARSAYALANGFKTAFIFADIGNARAMGLVFMTTDKTMEQKLAEWLSEQGYKLEFTTHAALKSAGFDPVLSHYVENSEGVLREIDVCHRKDRNYQGWVISVRFLCECKYSKRAPWLLMDSEESGDPLGSWNCLPHSTEMIPRFIEHQLLTPTRDYDSTWHFGNNQRWSHALTQGLRKSNDNRDSAYDSLRKISDAAWDWAAEIARQHKMSSLTIAIPCIVVDGPLYRANFDRDGQFEVTKIPFGRLIWSGCRQGTLVDVVQVDALPEYAKLLSQSVDAALGFLRRIADENPRGFANS